MSEDYIAPVKVNVDEEDKQKDNEGLKLYTSNGRHNYKDDLGNFRIVSESFSSAQNNPYVHAIEGEHKLFIKIGENGRVFNPYGLYTEGMETKQRVGRPTWKFRSVNRDCFNNYVTFLRTKNEVFLRHAERDLI